MLDQEKAAEYQQIAALVCLDLDVLKDIAEQPNNTADQLVKQILFTWEKKEKLIQDAQHRKSRYEAASLIFSAAAAGFVRSSPLQ